MTQTVQYRSCGYLTISEKPPKINKKQTEDNGALLLQIFDSLNKLYEKLRKLDYLIKRKKLEQILYSKGEKK